MADWSLLPEFLKYVIIGAWVLVSIAVLFFAYFVFFYIHTKIIQGKKRIPASRELLSADVAYFQEIGKREAQQDSYYISPLDEYRRRGLIVAVADGMGGLKYGDEISDLIVNCIEEMQPMNFSSNEQNADVIRKLSNDIYDEYRMQGGSTLAMIQVYGNFMHIYSVGDSDIILIRNGETTILNPRQNYASLLVKKYAAEGVSSSEAYVNRKSRGLVDFVGNHNPRVIYSREPIRVLDQDVIVVCSDGLTDALGTSYLSQYIGSDAKNTAERFKTGIKNKRLHKQDNYTGVVLYLKRGLL